MLPPDAVKTFSCACACRAQAAGIALLLLTLVVAPRPAHAQEVIEYYGTDHLGSVRVVFDATGNVVARADYLPFGEEVFVPTGPMPSQQFTGQARDGEAGQDYFHARMYLPRTGRFSSVDPVYVGTMDPQQWNRYTYAAGNPISFNDPTGMYIQCHPYTFTTPIKITHSGGNGGTITVTGGIGIGWTCVDFGETTPTPGFPRPPSGPQGSPGGGGTGGGGPAGPTTPGNDTNPDDDGPDSDGPGPDGPGPGPDQNPDLDGQDLFERIGHCASEQLGLSTLIGAGAVLAGQPIDEKPFRTPGSARGTSPASRYLGELFPGTLPGQKGWYAPTGGPFTGSPLRFARTRVVGRFVGRLVPFAGWGLLG